MNRLLAIFTRTHQPDRAALSALLDGQLAPEGTDALEAHVATCGACASTLEGMREVRAMLRALPEFDAPRSFRLRAADVEAPRRSVPAPPTTLMRAMPVLSGAAVLVFAIAVSFDVAANGGSEDNASAPLAAMADSASESSQYDAGGDDGFGAGAGPTTESAAAVTRDLPTASPPAPSAGAAAPDVPEDATVVAGFEARSGADGDVAPSGQDGEREIEATSAVSDGDGGNNLALRIVQITSAAVAIVAAVVGIRLWRKRGESTA